MGQSMVVSNLIFPISLAMNWGPSSAFSDTHKKSTKNDPIYISLLVLSPSYPHINEIFADVQRLEALGNRGHVRACAAARKKTTDRGENPLGGPKKGTHQTSRSNIH